MSWKEVLKAGCSGSTEKMGDCGCSACAEKMAKKEPKPDFLDLDKDGDTTEPMSQASKQAKK